MYRWNGSAEMYISETQIRMHALKSYYCFLMDACI